MWILDDIKNTVYGFFSGIDDTWDASKVIYNLLISSTMHTYRTNNEDNFNIRQNRETYWGKIKADCQDPSDRLCSHIKAFGIYDNDSKEVVITPKSMFYVMTEELGIKPDAADRIVAASIGLPVLNDVDTNISFNIWGLQGYFSPEVARKLMHPHDSSAFEKGTGKFVKEIFNTYIHCAKSIDDEQYISLDGMHKCKEYMQYAPERWKDSGLIQKLFGKIGNSGEFSAVIDVLASKKINGVPYAKVKDLKLWYNNTANLIEKMQNCEVQTLRNPASCKTLHSTAGLLDQIIDKAKTFSTYVTKENQAYFPQLNQASTCPTAFWVNPVMQNTCPAPAQQITAPTSHIPKLG